MPRLFRLRTILLVVLLSVLVMPAGAVYMFRIFENELVRETEQELISQAATLSAAWRSLVHPPDLARPVDPTPAPIIPELDLNDPVSPPRPDALPADRPPDPRLAEPARLFARIMAESQPITLSGMRLLDSHGTVLAGRAETGLSLAHVPEVRQAMDGQYASVIRQRVSDEPRPPIYSISRGTDVRVFAALPVLDHGELLGIVYLSRTPVSILQRLYTVRHALALAALAMGALTVALGLFVSSAIARPIRELLRQTEKVRKGEARTVTPIARPVSREVAQLSASFAALSETLAERNDYIRRFASHVSHEFKTPLTSMQGALELLLDHQDDMEPERRRQFLDNLLADTHRLKLLVSRLLELARADSLEPSAEACRLSGVVREVRSAFWDRGLAVDLDEDADSELPISPEALLIVLGNLAENSLQHGADRVVCGVRREEGLLVLSVQDNGDGISPANRHRIFTPFFTTRRESGGTGLGLEICRSILKAFHAAISAGESPAGALFNIAFRTAPPRL